MKAEQPTPKSVIAYRSGPHTGLSRKKRSDGFTLIELLVCITIIMILAALLMPVLGSVRFRSKEVVEANNMRQTAFGFINYAIDNEGKLPYHYYNRGDCNYIWLSDHNWLPIAKEYGFVKATGNPLTGATPWDDPDNAGSHAKETWTFFYSYRYTNSVYSNPSYKKGKGSDALVTDMVRHWGGTLYGSLHIRGYPIKTEPNNPSWTRNSDNIEWHPKLKMFLIQYDGSLQSATADELLDSPTSGRHYYRPNP